jgi:hypothetical protein
MQSGRHRHLPAVFLTALVLAALPAAAEVTTTLSGFGTFGGSLTSDGNFVYRHDSTEFTGAADQFDIGLDSRLGVQAVFDFGDNISVTAQEVFKLRGSSNFSPGTEWFFGQYAPTPYIELRLGRFAIDTFLLSDSINVGYAAVWFNAPNDIYASEPFKFLDGGQFFWTAPLGPVQLKIEGAFGQTSANLIVGGQDIVQSAKYATNVAVSLEYHNWLLRAANTHITAPLTLSLAPARSITYSNRDSFDAVGLQYDDGRAIVLTEWTKRTENDIPALDKPLAASTQWYVAAGWHYKQITPMVDYSVYKPATQLISPPGDFHSWSGILRYDIRQNIALKAQISRAAAGNTRYFVTPDFTSREYVNIYSVGADFIF